MSNLFALLQSDPNLLPCQLERLRPAVALGAEPGALGVGYYSNDDVLLKKRPGAAGADVALLAKDVESPAVLMHARGKDGPAFDDETTHPFRFRRWLWALDGELEGLAAYKAAWLTSLPDFLRRTIRSGSDSEHVFMEFAARLRERGRMDDLDLDAPTAAAMLGEAVARADALALAAGQKRPQIAVAATNGRVLIGLRRGRPLWYALLEGIVPCAVHGIDASTPDHHPLVRPHHRVRAVALASEVQGGSGWVEVPDGSTVGVSRSLQVSVASL